jgi:hypothetical protein
VVAPQREHEAARVSPDSHDPCCQHDARRSGQGAPSIPKDRVAKMLTVGGAGRRIPEELLGNGCDRRRGPGSGPMARVLGVDRVRCDESRQAPRWR